MLRVLFQGDSVTDCGRDREDFYGLGDGYAFFVSSLYRAMNPGKAVEFINRGISGNRVRDLRERWQKDAIALKPDILSIMIGINDTWRRYDNNDMTSAEKYYEDYRYILSETLKNKPDTRIILMEPYVMPKPADRKEWRVDLDPKIQMVRQLSQEFKTDFIPLDGLFAQAYAKADPAIFSSDGVHPSPVGHAFIAQKWLETANI